MNKGGLSPALNQLQGDLLIYLEMEGVHMYA